jgi:hypothetical protein
MQALRRTGTARALQPQAELTSGLKLGSAKGTEQMASCRPVVSRPVHISFTFRSLALGTCDILTPMKLSEGFGKVGRNG